MIAKLQCVVCQRRTVQPTIPATTYIAYLRVGQHKL